MEHYLNSGNDARSAGELVTAIEWSGSVQDTAVSLVSLQPWSTRSTASISGISQFRNFEFYPSEVKARKAFGIGPGLGFDYTSIGRTRLESMDVIRPFGAYGTVRRSIGMCVLPKNTLHPPDA